jgi:serine/threonine protein kinase
VIDVWSFGVIAFELLSGNLPWDREIEPLVLLDHIKHHERGIFIMLLRKKEVKINPVD